MDDRLADIKARLADTGAVRQSDANWLVDQLEQARRIAVELENENARLADERAKYVGKEPTIAEEMQHLNRCLNAVYDLCEQAKENAGRWETPLPVPEWVEAVEKAADGEREIDPWQRAVDGLNALIDAGIGFWIEPDGHISNPMGDEHIEYDRETERWRLVHDEEDDQ
ncbi:MULTISPECIES: hypothetical protein [Streptomyces]|uniref:hypothetical protein n=1 Tax=Streptomyces TaxID=1883 RepID=UPI000F799AF2|nr:hypothetical protein [Streptomyces sp. WAC05858]RSS39451.1 hypothetical protein EF902_27580 [Streptomyces sp. WAC05858]WTA79284.1 hypothetical protein OG751_04425 [Streptomyces antimycoticus]